MFRHLLVPLDGSQLAESALPAVRCLAETLDAEVTLLHLIESNAPRDIHGQSHLATAADAEEYLAKLAEEALPLGRPVQRHVHTTHIKDVAGSIVSHAAELDIDLIVLCTHGFGGVRHGLFGTVAQRVIALRQTPVLLVPSQRVAGFSYRRLLVPLDGDPDHEQGLQAVHNFRADGIENLLLLVVIPKWRDLQQSHSITSRMLPGTTSELLDASRNPAQEYLDAKLVDIQSGGWEISTSVVRGDPVRAIVTAARNFDADLIVLATHGTSYLDAFWSGSVTPRLARHSELPILLVPINKTNKIKRS